MALTINCFDMKGIIVSIILSLANCYALSPLHDRSSLLKDIADAGFNSPAYRLPTTVKPWHYDLVLEPYFNTHDENAFSFDGIMTIDISTEQADVKLITLHSEDLIINLVSLTSTSSNQPAPVDISMTYELQKSHDFLVITLNNENSLVPGTNYTIRINYRGVLRKDMTGFYRSWYRDKDNNIQWIGTTQFQPGHARRAFPCFDEPSFKATFDIHIDRPADFEASLSNMPIFESKLLINNKIRDSFFTTPIMSTYLIAFIVSNFKAINVTDIGDNRPFGIHSRSTAYYQGGYAFEVGIELLQAMDFITGIPYYEMADNMKMDQAAIPDFAAGAMENWGLLTYREAFLLYTDEDTNDIYKEFVASIISHEVAHMWYGNLVTCHWWSDLWLNEGFASYYQYFLTHLVEPHKYFDQRFVLEQLQPSLTADALLSSHPLSNPSVFSPDAVERHFSTITYLKGASVIRMMKHFLGQKIFEEGLRSYLLKHEFDTASPEDLYAEWNTAARAAGALDAYGANEPGSLLATWVEQAGFPLVTVAVNRISGDVTLTQRPYNSELSGNATLWQIPTSYASSTNPDFEDTSVNFVITQSSAVLGLNIKVNDWIILNKQTTGFYRVNYDEHTWDIIIALLRSDRRTDIHTLNRAQIVSDVMAFALGGMMEYGRAFEIISFLQFETDYMPWLAAISAFNVLRRRLAHEPGALQELHNFIINLSSTVVDSLGYRPIHGEEYLQGTLRLHLMNFLCAIGHEGCAATVISQFSSWRENTTFLDPNIRPWVYCNGLRRGTGSDYQFLWSRFALANVYSEKVVILTALGCTSHDESIRHLLGQIILDNHNIRDHDLMTAFTNAVNGNEYNSQVVFSWLAANIQGVSARFPSLFGPLQSIVNRLITDEDIIAFETWLIASEDTIGSSVIQTLETGIQVARNNLEWTSSRLDELRDAMIEEKATKDPETTTEPDTEIPTATETEVYDNATTPESNNSSVTLKCTVVFISFVARYLLI